MRLNDAPPRLPLKLVHDLIDYCRGEFRRFNGGAQTSFDKGTRNVNMSDRTFFDGLFASATASDDIVEWWNKVTSQKLQEEEDQEDFQDGICDLVLEIPDREAFDKEYSHLEGLASLPRPGRVPERSSAAPLLGSAQLAGKAEASLRTAMRFDRIRLIETVVEEPDWKAQGPQPLFAGWEALVPYRLPESQNIVQEIVDKHQARWDAAKVNVNAGVGGGGVEGFFGIVHGWFNPIDWISLYRAKSRNIYAWSGRDLSKPEDLGILNELESQLFDTTKYHGTSELMTVLTYGSHNHGTATLFRATLEPRKNMAAIIEPLATATDVPKQILRIMQEGVTSKIKLVQRGNHIRYLETGGQHYASAARVTTTWTNEKGKKFKTVWEIGDGWRRSLQIRHDPSNEDDGIVTTIPQMIALLHLKGSFLHNFASSPIQVFPEPLETVPYSNDKDQLHPNWKIKRGVKMLNVPERNGHFGSKVTVVVMFPEDSSWVNEEILWG
jgi:hypothetical protein